MEDRSDVPASSCGSGGLGCFHDQLILTDSTICYGEFLHLLHQLLQASAWLVVALSNCCSWNFVLSSSRTHLYICIRKCV